jgi:hypothetical protein
LGKAFACEITKEFFECFYSYLTTKRIEGMENMEDKNILTPACCTG